MKDANEAPSFSDLLGTATKRWQRAEEVMLLRECLGLEFYHVIGCKPEEVKRRQEVYEAALAVMKERWAKEDAKELDAGKQSQPEDGAGSPVRVSTLQEGALSGQGPGAPPALPAEGPRLTAFEGYDALPMPHREDEL